MTDELEKQFFDTFGIEPKYKTCVFKYCKNKKEYNCENCNDREYHYPQITNEILLKLICLWNTNCLYIEDMIAPTDYGAAKDCIFNYFIDIERYIFCIKREIIKQQVQIIFKETK